MQEHHIEENQRFKGMRLEWILMGALVLAVLIRVFYIGVREFWYDEVLSLLLAAGQRIDYSHPPDAPIPLADYQHLLQLPPLPTLSSPITHIKSILRGIVSQEPHPPLFFLSQYVWLFFTGPSEVGTRSLNLLISLGSMMAAYGMGRTLVGHRGGLLLAALLGLNPFFWFHSLNLRMYCPTVFWVTLSGCALLHLVSDQHPHSRLQRWLWRLLFIGSVAGGLLTYYLFMIWLMALGLLVWVCHRRHWWQSLAAVLVGALIASPWYYWGLPQQLRNVDLKRFSSESGWVGMLLQHIQGVLDVIGINLVVGDWATVMPEPLLITVGLMTVLALGGMLGSLRQQAKQQASYQVLNTVLILGFVPLLLALAADIVSGKSTISWGFGRSVIFILPGLLLLVTVWLMKLPQRLQRLAVLGCLLLYLSITMTDMAIRNRQVFTQLSASLRDSQPPILLVMNSKAWGHVLRLAYYLPKDLNLDLLAVAPQALPDVLTTTVSDQANPYNQVVWLEAHRPVWSKLKTEAEVDQMRQSVQAILGQKYPLTDKRELVGTSILDRFSLSTYR